MIMTRIFHASVGVPLETMIFQVAGYAEKEISEGKNLRRKKYTSIDLAGGYYVGKLLWNVAGRFDKRTKRLYASQVV